MTATATTAAAIATLNDRLAWRYATKAMDAERPASQHKVDAIVEAIRMTPTSSGTTRQ